MGRYDELLKKYKHRNLKMRGFKPKLPELKLDTSKAKPAFVEKKPTITEEEIDEMVRGPVDEGDGRPGPNWSFVIAVALIGFYAFARFTYHA